MSQAHYSEWLRSVPANSSNKKQFQHLSVVMQLYLEKVCMGSACRTDVCQNQVEGSVKFRWSKDLFCIFLNTSLKSLHWRSFHWRIRPFIFIHIHMETSKTFMSRSEHIKPNISAWDKKDARTIHDCASTKLGNSYKTENTEYTMWKCRYSGDFLDFMSVILGQSQRINCLISHNATKKWLLLITRLRLPNSNPVQHNPDDVIRVVFSDFWILFIKEDTVAVFHSKHNPFFVRIHALIAIFFRWTCHITHPLEAHANLKNVNSKYLRQAGWFLFFCTWKHAPSFLSVHGSVSGSCVNPETSPHATMHRFTPNSHSYSKALIQLAHSTAA